MRNNKRNVIAASMLMTLALLMNYAIPDMTNKDLTGVLRVMYKLRVAFQGQALLGTLLFCVFVIAEYKVYARYVQNKTGLMKLLALLFSVMMAIGCSMRETSSFKLLDGGVTQLIKTMILIAGYYIFYLHSAVILYGMVKEKAGAKCKAGQRFFESGHFKRPFLLLLLVWMPQVIVKYPGAMCYDSYNQLLQYFGYRNFTSHHPPFHTWIIGMFTQAGKCLGSKNAGIFLFVIVQTVAFIAILCYTFVLFEKWRVDTIYRSVVLVVYLVIPYYVGYTGVVVKDTMYGMCFLWYFLCLLNCFKERKESLKEPADIVMLVASSTLVTLFRNNGIYVVAPMALALAWYFGRMFWNEKRRMVRTLFIVLAPVVLYCVINSILFSAFSIEKGSKREMLSIPFQQTARYVREYKEEVTEKEQEAIDGVLDYEIIGEVYDPRISDPVKATYKDQSTAAQQKAYFKVWFGQFVKHPRVYFEATCNSIYGLFCPNVDNYIYYVNANVENPQELKAVLFTTPKILEGVQEGLTLLYEMVHDIPVVSLFGNIGFYVIVFCFLFAFMVKDKRYEELLLFIPGALSIAICIASPVVLGHPRYMFPVVYTVPALFVFYTVRTKKE